MARLGATFNAQEHDTEQRDYAELPNGIYQLEIEASEVAQTKTGSGTILKTTNVVIEPEEFKGRKIFNNYNLENINPQAQEIGQKQFASLCRAIGLQSVDDSEELHFRAFTVKVGLGKPSKDGQHPARAEIKRYFFPDEGNVPQPEIDAVQPTPARAAPANDNRRPAANDNQSEPAKAAGGRPWVKR
ncbi:DUF669 domain-containing protein [Limoniibacter endophyticus]|uniref:DUF669 domain-containing protein n=1 Tax=Limoniibacter endophyticus TaxID=1565040 RepID=A0A8J3DFI7_9HYPH|nr:DUF669 domain-containing protein [Limoniibacter endophyticus]GHC61356.1 hypothetical protein GCM10010136_01850 [Limoniibacter endophyticus]